MPCLLTHFLPLFYHCERKCNALSFFENMFLLIAGKWLFSTGFFTILRHDQKIDVFIPSLKKYFAKKFIGFCFIGSAILELYSSKSHKNLRKPAAKNCCLLDFARTLNQPCIKIYQIIYINPNSALYALQRRHEQLFGVHFLTLFFKLDWKFASL